MSRLEKLIEKLWRETPLTFREFISLIEAFGFHLNRTNGSHRIFVHPLGDRPLSVQPVGTMAKHYQVVQFRAMVRRLDLKAK